MALKDCQIRPVWFCCPAVDSQDKLLRHAAHAYIVYGMVKGTSFFSVFLGFLFGVWVVTLWTLSSLTGQDIHLPSVPEADKVAHFGYFFIGGFLLAWVLRRTLGWRGWKLLCGALYAIALIGALDELHQLYTPNRSGGDPADWTADCAGGAFGALVIGWIYVRGRDRRPQAPSGAFAQGD
jgi:VanZ family protein